MSAAVESCLTEIGDVYPPPGHVQRIYCEGCGKHLRLAFEEFEETLSGITVTVHGLGVLRCPACQRRHFPDLARLLIIEAHKSAFDQGLTEIEVTKRKRGADFNFTPVPFLHDADDHFLIPGLHRGYDRGFLTPVFFKRTVLLKYDNSPDYTVEFASTTYGTLFGDDISISFGINDNGLVVMWLGDIASLPEAEQYYLRSENVPSDHCLGSEFYDGQIECIFTALSRESELFAARSMFLDAANKRLGHKLAHLDDKVLDLSLALNPPTVDTVKERRHVTDTLNKIYVESFDNAALGGLVKSLGATASGTGILKRLQAILEKLSPEIDVATIMSPLYVVNHLRNFYSHLSSSTQLPQESADYLGVAVDIELPALYDRLIEALTATFDSLKQAIEGSYFIA